MLKKNYERTGERREEKAAKMMNSNNKTTIIEAVITNVMNIINRTGKIIDQSFLYRKSNVCNYLNVLFNGDIQRCIPISYNI